MRIAVYGVGGVGGYFGGRLAQAGEEVIFIARGQHLQAIQESGLRVESILGNFRIQPAQAVAEPERVGVVDVILLGVKAWQVPDIAARLLPMLGPESAVLPLQNGVDAAGQLAAALGEQHVLGGLCQISAYIAGPGWIRHVGIEPVVRFNELDGQASPRVDALRQAFDNAGVQVEVPADIQAALWRKFLLIAAISSVGAVARAPVGVTRAVPETRQMLIQALQEIANLAEAEQIRLEPDIAAMTLARIDQMAPTVVPSMQRDIQEGRPSELEAQTGAVVRMGHQAGCPTPVFETIYASLLPQEKLARGEIQFP